MKIKILKRLTYLKKIYDKDSIIDIKTDEHGTPIDHFWRNRVSDSKIDHCVEVVNENKELNKKKDK